MHQTDRESRSRRIFYAMILGLLVSYIGIKTWHVMLAMDAYQGQPLERTHGAAK